MTGKHSLDLLDEAKLRPNALHPLGQREEPIVLRPVRAAHELARVELQHVERVVGHQRVAQQASAVRAERVLG